MRLLGCLALSATFPLSVLAQGEVGEKVYKATLKGTVWIVAPLAETNAAGQVRVASGTGSLIDKTHRLVITNYHVVGDASEVRILFPSYSEGRLVAEKSFYKGHLNDSYAILGDVLVRDQQHDLALIRLRSVPNGTRPILLARESAVPGQRVHSVGNPGVSGTLWVYTSGTVRSPVYKKRWEVRDGRKTLKFDANVVETQSPTNPGDSGGPLVNDRGELVAVTEGYASNAQLVSLFVDVGEVRALLKRNKLLAGLPRAPEHNEERATTKVDPARDDQGHQRQEQRAASKLQFAKMLAHDGKFERAKERCEEIITSFPMTKSATEAKLLLDQLSKDPDTSVAPRGVP
jgi:hypothetical protein